MFSDTAFLAPPSRCLQTLLILVTFRHGHRYSVLRRDLTLYRNSASPAYQQACSLPCRVGAHVGDLDLATTTDDVVEFPPQDIEIEQLIRHPDYRRTFRGLRNDVALIKLKSEIQFSGTWNWTFKLPSWLRLWLNGDSIKF